MIDTVFLNGAFLPAGSAMISPLDRGFLFGDGIYEVIPVFNGVPFYLGSHLDRLEKSLQEVQIPNPHTSMEWEAILNTLIQKNNGGDQFIYLQITRGTSLERSHEFPQNISQTVYAMSTPKPRPTKTEIAKGIKTISVMDLRWKLCHIKTTARIAYVLMHQKAKMADCDEAIIMNKGYATEGTISNFFIVRHGVIYTPPQSSLLLSGITRGLILRLAEKNKIPYRETKISEGDCLKADEMWISSSTKGIRPVIEFNGAPVGNQKAGPLWERLWDLYAEEITQVSEPVSN